MITPPISKLTPSKLSKKEQAAQEEALLVQQRIDTKRIKSFEADTWKKFENWGRESGKLSQHLQTYCFGISGKIRKAIKFEPFDITNGIKILEIIEENASEILIEVEKPIDPNAKVYPKLEVTLEVLNQAIQWDKKNKKLKSISFEMLANLASERKPLTDQNKKIAGWNLEILQKCGFEYKP
ncbi:MAG: hypothetical protein EAZ27_11470 [Cytophagales bacterium]|nr:MAG: hypothetical protein EAZ27_11470 [Cytophagales bacterium]